ncbi:MAG: N-acetyltransferase family protein [Armatimonadota bacterium]|nr:N-acetyltransferase family protein [Armatimonadota bacterium]MDR7484707.1 N-acetyltransferase family protein [Armatimonadota bacterium]MDR7531822.1 N-acetyltransferase family protein [Armatimonadota bacterium]MDR7534833.1 N-acetyltransferase family protein [Armatimonadota bacterium]
MTPLRIATREDAPAICAIYAPIVRETAISFEIEPPSVAEMAHRIRTTLARYPWIVCAPGGAVLGYAYAGPHRTRAAYQWSVDVSIYVAAAARRRGVGRALYAALLEILRLQGFYNAFAGIGLPNPASVGLHEAMGFVPVGVYRTVGFKLGRWHDVGWWQRSLREAGSPPVAPVPFAQLRGDPAVAGALRDAARWLRLDAPTSP